MKKTSDPLVSELYAEYRKSAVKKRLFSERHDLHNAMGYGWYSQAMNKWCFLPLRKDFSLDTIYVIGNGRLLNI
jgi:hypothetical protein